MCVAFLIGPAVYDGATGVMEPWAVAFRLRGSRQTRRPWGSRHVRLLSCLSHRSLCCMLVFFSAAVSHRLLCCMLVFFAAGVDFVVAATGVGPLLLPGPWRRAGTKRR